MGIKLVTTANKRFQLFASCQGRMSWSRYRRGAPDSAEYCLRVWFEAIKLKCVGTVPHRGISQAFQRRAGLETESS